MTRLIRWLGTIGLVSIAGLAAAPVRALTVTDTSVADFSAGTLGACAVAEVGDGELMQTPTEGTEFSGAALPAGWLLSDWNPPSGLNTTIVGGGVLLANSARINRDPLAGPAPWAPGRSLEFVAVFGAQTFQHIGFGGGDQAGVNAVFNGPPWAMFSTGSQTANVLARVHNGSSFTDTPVAVNDGSPHRYRIDWSATQIDFFVDDVLVLSDTTNLISANMRGAISDFPPGLPGLTVDWIRMTPYGAPCVYLSALIDGGNPGADWTTLASNARVQPGTAVGFETRSGNVTPPDGTWSAFVAVGIADAIASPNGRHLQYRATVSSTDPDETAELQDVSVSYDACAPAAEICSNGIDEDCDGSDLACTPTPTFTPVPTATDTPVPPTPTVTATATAALCGNSNVDLGEHCDDGNTENGDCCSSTCQFEPTNSPCNDHNTCTSGEKCNGVGQCVGFTACNTALTCNICGTKCAVTAGVCKCG